MRFEADVNIITSKGQIALHLAAQYIKQADIIRSILRQTEDIHHVDFDYCIPLYCAIYKRNHVAIEVFLDWNILFIDMRYKLGFCLALLDGSTYPKDEKMVELFTQREYTLTSEEFEYFFIPQPWKDCLESNYFKEECESIVSLVNAGNTQKIYFEFLVMKAAVTLGLHQIFISLLNPLANLNIGYQNGRSFLHVACDLGHLEIAKILLTLGTNVDIRDADNMTPLHFAAKNNFPEIVQLLLEKGANIEANNKSLETPLFLAVYCGSYDTLLILLKAGCDVNCPDLENVTPLHNAAEFEQERMIQLLLQNDADIDAKIASNETPLEIILKRNSKENLKIMQIFLNNGASYFADYQTVNFRNYHKKLITFKIKAEIIGRKNINYEISDTRAETCIFRGDCEDEIERMKITKIGRSPSIYDLLIKTENDLSLFLRNEIYVNNLKAIFLKKMFPIYGAIFETKIIRALRRSRLLKMAHHCLEHLFQDLISPIVSDKILSILDNLALRRFIIASSIDKEKKDEFLENSLNVVLNIRDYVD